MWVTKTAETKKSPFQVIAVTTSSKESQTNEFVFFIGLFAMRKFYKILLFMLETLTFMCFRGIIYSNILIVLPHNADYVVFLILHPYKSHSLHLLTVNISVFNGINSRCVDATVSKDISKTNDVFLQ